MRLLADGTRFLGLWIGASSAEITSLQRELAPWPLALRSVVAESDLARHVVAGPGTLVLVRPDAYIAAQIDAPTRERVETAMRLALALEASP
jgi:hypothetical protein